MIERCLVTGGTGTLGREVVSRLPAAGTPVRVLSRRPRPDGVPAGEWGGADLRSGRDVDAAFGGVDVVVHCATAYATGREVDVVRTVVDAARRAGGPHLLYVSIVGADRVPLGYYRGKLAGERLLERSGLPHTILRSTQFHDLVRVALAAVARAPVVPVPAFRLQPIDVRDVAARLVELAAGAPLGRAADIGGPAVRDVAALARSYLRLLGRRRWIRPVRWPGAAFRAYASGAHLAPEAAVAGIPFERYLAEHPDPAALSYRGHRG